MKGRKLLAMALVCTVLGTGTVAAASPWGEYHGFAKVNVKVNNNEASLGNVPGFMIDGSVVLPLRKLAELLQALVKWDSATNTVDIYKPNVHLFVGEKLLKDGKNAEINGIQNSFGLVQKGKTQYFVVFAQVDSLETSISSLKIDIVSPSGEVVDSHETDLENAGNSFWYPWPFEVKFTEYGSYHVQLSMKIAEGDDYTVVAQKEIKSQ
ncbi:stalk domain-containing protein [Paenibacillus sp. y28]